MFRPGGIACAFVLLTLAGCFQALMMTSKLATPGADKAEKRPPGSMPLFGDEARMKQEVLKAIQPGMKFDQARTIMEAKGFHCIEECLKDGQFYLACSANQYLGTHNTLSVRVYVDRDRNGTVSAIHVETESTGT